MILRCPSCGREGNVPDRVGRAARAARCRRCGTRFSTLDGPENAGLRSASIAVESAAVDRVLASLSPPSFSPGSDEEIPIISGRSPSDSQYEMHAVLGGDPDDSQIELPAFDGEALSGEIDAARPFDTASGEVLLPMPWYFNVIGSWGRLHFYVAIGFATSSLAVLGFLLFRALVAGSIVSSSITALIIGCVGTIAFFMLTLSASVLTALLFDLARNVRTLIQQGERSGSGQIVVKNQDHTRLSHPVG